MGSRTRARSFRGLSRVVVGLVLIVAAQVTAQRGASALSPAIGNFDGIAGVDPTNAQIHVQGWALTSDYPTTALGVRIVVDGTIWPMANPGYVFANTYRPDVGAAYPGYGNYHGYDFWTAAPHGTHSVCIQAQNSGVYNQIGSCISYTMSGQSWVIGTFESIAGIDNVNQKIRVVGWTLTSDYPTSAIGVRILIDGYIYLMPSPGYVLANTLRTDIGAAYPGYGNYHGLDAWITVPFGSHAICLQGQNNGVYNTIGNCSSYNMRLWALPLDQNLIDNNSGPLTPGVCHHGVCAQPPNTVAWAVSNSFWAIDLFGSEQSPEYAIKGGYVQSSGWNNSCGWRLHIGPNSSNSYNYDWMYCHGYSQPSVSAGQWVQTGQQVMTMGHTGSSSGGSVHLHHELRYLINTSNWGNQSANPPEPVFIGYCSRLQITAINNGSPAPYTAGYNATTQTLVNSNCT